MIKILSYDYYSFGIEIFQPNEGEVSRFGKVNYFKDYIVSLGGTFVQQITFEKESHDPNCIDFVVYGILFVEKGLHDLETLQDHLFSLPEAYFAEATPLVKEDI